MVVAVVVIVSSLQQMNKLGDAMNDICKFAKEFIDASNWPSGFNTRNYNEESRVVWRGKRYPRFERYSVNGNIGTSDTPILVNSFKRYSCREYDVNNYISVNKWWHIANSIMKQDCGQDSYMPFGSAGGIWGMEVYLWCERVTGVPKGLYHVLPFDRKLEYLWEIPLEVMMQVFPSQEWAVECNFMAIVSANLEPYSFQYGNRGIRFALMECGSIYQVLSRASTEIKVGHCILGGFSDELLTKILDIREEDSERVLCAVSFGEEATNQ